MSIIVVDYDAGNLRSVQTALDHLGASYEVTSQPNKVLEATKVIFPGVGDGAHAMGVLRDRGLDTAITQLVAKDIPVLGICVGCQVAFDMTEEWDATCLGLVPGKVRRFSPEVGKVPHMGWNTVSHIEDHWLFDGIPQDASFYFVHSYYPSPASSADAIAWSDYGGSFVAGVEKGSFVATQFHPEKSGESGLRLLRNFLEAN